MKFGKGGPAERDSTGRPDLKQEVTKPVEEQEVPQGASNGPQAKNGGRGSFNNQEDFTKIPSLPKLHFSFEKAFKYVSAEFAPIVQSRIFKKSLPQLSGPFSFSPHPPYLGLPTPSECPSVFPFFGGARSSLRHVESCCLTRG